MTIARQKSIETVPEGFAPTGRASYFDGLGVEVVFVRNVGYCAPEWAIQLLQFRNRVDSIPPQARMLDHAMTRLVRLDLETRAAAMSVFVLGGLQALTQYLGEEQ